MPREASDHGEPGMAPGRPNSSPFGAEISPVFRPMARGRRPRPESRASDDAVSPLWPKPRTLPSPAPRATQHGDEEDRGDLGLRPGTCRARTHLQARAEPRAHAGLALPASVSRRDLLHEVLLASLCHTTSRASPRDPAQPTTGPPGRSTHGVGWGGEGTGPAVRSAKAAARRRRPRSRWRSS